jgi:glutamate-1-semialdehyde 2,1-aminomutase
MLQQIANRPPYAELERKAALLEKLLTEKIAGLGLSEKLCLVRRGSLLTLFFAAGPMTDFASVKRSDTKRYAAFFHEIRKRGVFLPPAQFEAWFVSTAHTESDLRRTAKAAGESLAAAFALQGRALRPPASG